MWGVKGVVIIKILFIIVLFTVPVVRAQITREFFFRQ